MGSRHNRKRTRSRPRNRRPAALNGNLPYTYDPNLSISSTSSSSSWCLPCSSTYPPAYSPVSPTFYQPLSTPSPSALASHKRSISHVVRQQPMMVSASLDKAAYAAAMEAERQRMFGGEKGDEVALCAPMLRVVMDLFGGNVDYEDP